MRIPMTMRNAGTYLAAGGVVALTAALVATIYLTTIDLQWQAFLGGVLMAASLSLASRVSSSTWTIARRTAQLNVARAKLAAETEQRQRAERALAAAQPTEEFSQGMLPAMLSYVDADRHLLFHNKAFAEGLQYPGQAKVGADIEALVGPDLWPDESARLDEAFSGSVVRFERLEEVRGSPRCRVAGLYLPRFGDHGKVLGVFCVRADITSREDLRVSQDDAGKHARAQALYSTIQASELTAWENVAQRLRVALEGDEFTLHGQAIEPARERDDPPMLEILLRLREEEENLVPPGAFLPLAEEHGLMPQLDGWVVRTLLEWVDMEAPRRSAIYSVNVSGASMADPTFCAGVVERLRGRPQPLLCFEVNEAEALADPASVSAFVTQLGAAGCRFALSGFGRPPVSFELPRKLRFDYIKIEGGTVLKVGNDPVALARVKAINRVAHSLGAKTIAECVEDDEARALLWSAGVDYLQGFAVHRPVPLDALPPPLGQPSA